MKRTKKALLSILLAMLFLFNGIIPTLPTMSVYAATTDMDANSNSTVNPPQSILEKTDIASWSYGSAAEVTAAAPTFKATSGYYQKSPDGSDSTLKLFKNNAQYTTGFGYSTSTISNNTYNDQADQGFWLIKTSTKGYKDLVFNFKTRSSGTGPRDFNTEWSTDGTSWNVFGNITASTGYTVKIETTKPAEGFGMVLPAEAANQDTIYIRIIQKSNMSEGGVNPVASGGTHGINNIQLYGSKDPFYTTPNVTISPNAVNAILDVTPITLSCADPAAQIYYTTDGTTPTISINGSVVSVSGSAVSVNGSAVSVSGSAVSVNGSAVSVSGSAVSVSGSTISASGSTILYTGPFTALSQGGFNGTDPYVIKAIAVSPLRLPSDVQTISYNQQTVTSNSAAKLLSPNTYVWVKGVGTYLNGNTTLYIQDGMSPGSGLCIYKSGANFSSYLGKEIYVYGKTSPYNGLMEIVPDIVDTTNIIVRNEKPILPTPTKIMLSQLSDRSYEGMLVSLDTIKLNTVAGTKLTSYYNHTISQGGTPSILRAKGIDTTVGITGNYVNVTQAIVNYNSNTPYNGAYLFSNSASELVHAATPSVSFITTNVASGTTIPLNSIVTLTTVTKGATITYSLNGGTPVTSTGNSIDVTVSSFTSNGVTMTATASDGTYTTAPQTFTYKQSQVADVTANPSSLSISVTTPITLASASKGAQIVYSLYKNSYSESDGTLVGTANQVYTGPITVDASFFPIRIVAKATLTNYLDSKSSTFKYTAAKAAGGEKNYYGSIHAHTAENSDGQGTIAEANAYARDVGKFDFFILADHSNTFDKAPASDTLATMKDLNSYNTTNQQWVNGKTEAAKATTDKFLCDYAYEMTWSGGPGHMNTFNTTGFVSRNNTILNNKTSDDGMKAYYQLLKNTPGSITQFNHPGATFGNFSDFAYYDPAIDARVNLIEVGNGEGAVGSGGYFPSIDQYILALDKGWHLAPTNNGDNHKKGWGTSNTCATVIYTNDFTMSGIYQAMQDRSVWATENRDLDVTYHLSDGTNTYSMGAILDSPPATADITITAKNKNTLAAASNIASIELISNSGKVVNKKTYGTGSSDITYSFSMTAPQAGYYFAIITDNQGFRAVTAPIWLGSAPKVGITSVANSTIMPVTTEALSLTTTLFNNESTPATLKSISYTLDGDAAASATFTPDTSIAPNGSATHVFNYTPTTPGAKAITISAVITIGGVDLACSTTTTMKVLDINSVSYVGLDASHGNEYVSGGSYPNSMANMMLLAAKNGLRVVQLNSSEALINACSNPKYKIIILNAPTRKNVSPWTKPTNYTTDEIAALKTFSENGNTLVFGTIADYAEASNKDSATPPKHMSELQNDVLSAIGSTLRESDDEVMDDTTNGGQPYRLYPTEFNLSNPLLQGVVSGQTYSQYSGATIYAVDPATGERTTTLPSTVNALIYGFPTTYSAECDKDNFGYGTTKDAFPYVTVGSNKTDKGLMNADGIYIPKYVNQSSKVATNPEEKLLAASEYVKHSNGKSSLVVVAGGTFMSNFEIAITMDNAATLPYVNYNIMDNIYKTANPEKITSIADAKKLADGTEVILEATATSEVNTQNVNANTNKGFFDCIYAQDATGGINLFPVASGIQEGQKARFYGKITHYQGEVELSVTNFKVIDQTITKITPTAMSTEASMSPANTGALVKTTGEVSNVVKDADGTINQFTLNDGSGPAIIFINGYITKGTTLSFIKDGATVSVVGLASIGEVVSDPDMHSRIRVRDRAEIVDLTAEKAADKAAAEKAAADKAAAEKAAAEKAAADKAAADKIAADKAAADKVVEKAAVDKATVEIDLSKEDFSDAAQAKKITIKSDDVFKEIKDNSGEKVTVLLKLPMNALSNEKTDLVLNGDVLNTLKETGKDLTVSVKNEAGKERYAWTFDKDDLNNSTQKITDVNLSLKVSSIDTNSELSNSLKQKSENGLIISFSNEGVLPAKASVRVYVGDQKGIKPGDVIYLYYHDLKTGKLVALPYSSNYMVDQEGYVTINILHCSQYVILKEQAADSQVTSLLSQISVTVKKRTLYIGTNPSVTTMTVVLPSTLELLNSMNDKTSQNGIGGVTAVYQSTDSKVIAIDRNGEITAKGVGKATILTTITIYSGQTKVVKTNITVKPTITFINSKETMKIGDTFTFKVSVFGLDNKNITWTTTKKAIITINRKTGKAVAKSKGTDYVVAKIDGISTKIKVVVK